MIVAPNFPLTPAGYFGAMLHRMLEWLTLRMCRADQGYQPALSPRVRAQTQAIHERLVRVGRLFARLAELARTGGLRTYPDRASPRPRSETPATPATPAGAQSFAAAPEPHHPGWMLEFVPADFATRLAWVLTVPDMVALIQSAPQAARLLRPLCRGLGVVPQPGVFPQPPARKPRPRRPTPGARSLSPAASSPPRRLTAADTSLQRHPRPWGSPQASSGHTPRVTGWASRRDGVPRGPG